MTRVPLLEPVSCWTAAAAAVSCLKLHSGTASGGVESHSALDHTHCSLPAAAGLGRLHGLPFRADVQLVCLLLCRYLGR